MNDDRRQPPPLRLHDFAPVTLLRRFLPGDGSAATFLHQSHSRYVWRRRGFRIGLDLLFSLVVWPWLTLGSIRRFTRRNGRSIASRTGKGRARQMLEQAYVAFRYGVPPRWYYIFELHDDERRRKATHYLQRFETKGGAYLALKQKRKLSAPPSPLGDKLAFASTCLEKGLPVVPVLLAFKDGAIVRRESGEAEASIERAKRARSRSATGGGTPTERESLPPLDLFVKPRRGKGGKGAERWDYRAPGSYLGSDGSLLSGADLLQRLETLSSSAEGGTIVQPRVANHAAIADLSNGALLTARIMSCLDESGNAEVTHAVFRMARGRNCVVDNFHAGGIAAKVDIRSGELGSATDLGARATTGWCDRHPDNSAAILGRTLPLWPETVALIRRAHAAFPGFVVIGWDVALLEDGPHLVEANGAPDLDIIQRTHREPLGNARLGQLLALHVGAP